MVFILCKRQIGLMCLKHLFIQLGLSAFGDQFLGFGDICIITQSKLINESVLKFPQPLYPNRCASRNNVAGFTPASAAKARIDSTTS